MGKTAIFAYNRFLRISISVSQGLENFFFFRFVIDKDLNVRFDPWQPWQGRFQFSFCPFARYSVLNGLVLFRRLFPILATYINASADGCTNGDDDNDEEADNEKEPGLIAEATFVF